MLTDWVEISNSEGKEKNSRYRNSYVVPFFCCCCSSVYMWKNCLGPFSHAHCHPSSFCGDIAPEFCVLPAALGGSGSRQSVCPGASILGWILCSVQSSQRAAQRMPAETPCCSVSIFPSPTEAGQLKIRELLKN